MVGPYQGNTRQRQPPVTVLAVYCNIMILTGVHSYIHTYIHTWTLLDLHINQSKAI